MGNDSVLNIRLTEDAVRNLSFVLTRARHLFESDAKTWELLHTQDSETFANAKRNAEVCRETLAAISEIERGVTDARAVQHGRYCQAFHLC